MQLTWYRKYQGILVMRGLSVSATACSVRPSAVCASTRDCELMATPTWSLLYSTLTSHFLFSFKIWPVNSFEVNPLFHNDHKNFICKLPSTSQATFTDTSAPPLPFSLQKQSLDKHHSFQLHVSGTIRTILSRVVLHVLQSAQFVGACETWTECPKISHHSAKRYPPPRGQKLKDRFVLMFIPQRPTIYVKSGTLLLLNITFSYFFLLELPPAVRDAPPFPL